jgi:hypothetical protein
MPNNYVPRRTFLKVAALGAAGAALSNSDGIRATLAEEHLTGAIPTAKDAGVKLGVASYSLRNFPRAKAIEMTKALGTPYINLKSVHLPYDASPTEIAAARGEVAAAGLQIVGGGLITF